MMGDDSEKNDEHSVAMKKSEGNESPEEEFSHLRQLVCSVIPSLSESSHKGQSGRIGVIGGSREYTGAPYFSAISSLKTGADLSYVFCTNDAATVIKSYSPELIVYPVLDSRDGLEEIISHLPRLHALVIGPGLGRNDDLLSTIGAVINKVKELDIPMVLDADALHFVSKCPDIIKGCKNAILTPNAREFDKLYAAVYQSEPSQSQKDDQENIMLKDLCNTLGGITILRKGTRDFISDGTTLTMVNERGSARRCGGQGDLMSGSLATFAFWSNQAFKRNHQLGLQGIGSNVIACAAASMLTRRCGRLAFAKQGRSMIVGDMVKEIRTAFVELFPVD